MKKQIQFNLKLKTMKSKSFVVTIIAICISFVSIAQQEYNYSYCMFGFYSSSNSLPKKYVPLKTVKEITTIKKDKKGKVKMYRKKYDTEGRLIEYHVNLKGEGFNPLTIQAYHKLSKKIMTKLERYSSKGEIETRILCERNEEGFPLDYEKTNSKGKIIGKNTWLYNDDGKILESKRYYKAGEKIKNTWKYEYNSDGEKTRSILLDKKGIIEHEWTFDCNEEGTKLEKVKDQTQICKWSETKDKYLIKVYQTFNEKGEIRKHVTKFTINDTLMVESSSYNSNDVLTYKATYDENIHKRLTMESYYKGKLNFKKTYKYSGDLLIKMEQYRRKGLFMSLEYAYNKDSLLIKEEECGKKGLVRRLEYTYDKNNLLIKEESFWKKGLVRRYEYTYDKDSLLIETKRINKKEELILTTNYEYVL